jgi:NAD(P)H-flavin reductase
MNKIVRLELLSDTVVLLEIEAPRIAKKRKAGQFIILKIDEAGERIPLTIADANTETGTITIIAQIVGKTTKQLSKMKVGDFIQDFVGPLGKPTHIENFGNVVCIGGGIGVAPLHPIAQALKANGSNVRTIIGARNKDIMIMEDEIRKASSELIIMTDDGSYGKKGFVTNALQDMIDNGDKIDLVVAIGPPIMMKMVAKVSEPYKIPTLASLNTIMVDGTGMCGGCRVTIDGKVQFVCVDGPEFDAHKTDFDEMMMRLSMYKGQEKEALDKYEYNCNLEGGK